jgi:hypothetical protein
MPEFLVEAYVPRLAAETGSRRYADDVSAAAERITEEGRYVRLRRWILVPEEETGFYLFHAQSGAAVREAATQGGLSFERIVEAVSDWEGKADAH